MVDGTTAGSAGDAVRTQINDLKSDLDNLPYKKIYKSNFTWKNWYYVEGNLEPRTTRAITIENIFVRGGTIVSLSDKESYFFTVHGFSDSSCTEHYFGGEKWLTDDFIVPRDSYIRLQIRRVDDEDINVETINSSIFSIFYIFKIGRENLENDIKIINSKCVDLFIFMGQSNMAGRGITNTTWTESAPTIIDGAGYEFRAISDPTKLYPIVEPFGVAENKSGGINDGSMKTGSMVTAFANAYYSNNGGIPIVGVSASAGGSKLNEWQIDSAQGYLSDAIARFNSAKTWLESNGWSIRHKYVLWCQGESDGDSNTSESDFKTMFETMLNSMMSEGIEKLFMVRIGNCNIDGSENRYKNIISWQNEIAQTNKDVVMVSCDFAGMRERGLMKDNFHYYQKGYNECGTYAGINTALYVTTGKEPTMYDSEDGSLYYSHKN